MKELTNAEIRKKYDSFASKYDRFEGIGEWLIIGRMRRRILSGVSGRVLDVGIGTGKNLKYYCPNCKIIGIDYSFEMLNLAKKRAKSLGVKADFRIMDAQKLKYRSNSFDYVIGTLGLCTYPDPVKVLKEMKKVCKKGGKILLLEHGESNNRFVRKIQGIMKKKQLEKLGCHVDRKPDELVKKAGLKIMSCERRLFGVLYVIAAEK